MKHAMPSIINVLTIVLLQAAGSISHDTMVVLAIIIATKILIVSKV